MAVCGSRGGSTAAGPPGYGDGEYRPVGDPQTVVAVVGSAHVRGIVREWEWIEGEGQSECLQRLNELLGDNDEYGGNTMMQAR